MAKYKRKPLEIEVEAEQFFPDKKPWPKNVIEHPATYYFDTHGPHHIWEGDWVVTEKNGKQEVYSPEGFEDIFEPVDK